MAQGYELLHAISTKIRYFQKFFTQRENIDTEKKYFKGKFISEVTIFTLRVFRPQFRLLVFQRAPQLPLAFLEVAIENDN